MFFLWNQPISKKSIFSCQIRYEPQRVVISEQQIQPFITKSWVINLCGLLHLKTLDLIDNLEPLGSTWFFFLIQKRQCSVCMLLFNCGHKAFRVGNGRHLTGHLSISSPLKHLERINWVRSLPSRERKVLGTAEKNANVGSHYNVRFCV